MINGWCNIDFCCCHRKSVPRTRLVFTSLTICLSCLRRKKLPTFRFVTVDSESLIHTASWVYIWVDSDPHIWLGQQPVVIIINNNIFLYHKIVTGSRTVELFKKNEVTDFQVCRSESWSTQLVQCTYVFYLTVFLLNLSHRRTSPFYFDFIDFCKVLL